MQAEGVVPTEPKPITLSAQAQKDLRWFFQHAEGEAVMRFALYQAEACDIPDRADRFIRDRRDLYFVIRTALRAIEPAHADALGWAYEQRQHEPALTSLVGEWASVAVRTDATKAAVRVATTVPRRRPPAKGTDKKGRAWSFAEDSESSEWFFDTSATGTGDVGRRGVSGFVRELPPKGETLAGINVETSLRVRAALIAYEDAFTKAAADARASRGGMSLQRMKDSDVTDMGDRIRRTVMIGESDAARAARLGVDP